MCCVRNWSLAGYIDFTASNLTNQRALGQFACGFELCFGCPSMTMSGITCYTFSRLGYNCKHMLEINYSWLWLYCIIIFCQEASDLHLRTFSFTWKPGRVTKERKITFWNEFYCYSCLLLVSDNLTLLALYIGKVNSDRSDIFRLYRCLCLSELLYNALKYCS